MRPEELRNITTLYNPYTIKQLQYSYPYLNWLEYVNAMLPIGFKVTENETVINAAPKFFEKLRDVLNTTSKRTIANYLVWRIVLVMAQTLTADLREYAFDYST